MVLKDGDRIGTAVLGVPANATIEEVKSNKNPSMEVESTVRMPPKPDFKPLKAQETSDGAVQFRKIPVPAHRRKPLREDWEEIYDLVYNRMKVDIRMNTNNWRVELKNKHDTPDVDHLQKCADFVHALVLGFEVADASSLLKVDDLYVDSFEIKDVKTLRGEHLSRAVGRLSGKSGRTKFAIENTTTTRIIIADTRIHILGPFARIKIAKNCLCSLILGSPAAKVYSKLRLLASRLDRI